MILNDPLQSKRPTVTRLPSVREGLSSVNSARSTPQPSVSREERVAIGKELRRSVSRQSHAGWHPRKERPDPIEIVVESSKGGIRTLADPDRPTPSDKPSRISRRLFTPE